MRTSFLLLFFFSFMAARAQRECATEQYQQLLKANVGFGSKLISSSIGFPPKTSNAGESINKLTENYIIRIPVVVHILYSQASQNISDAQVKTQIDILNKDFRRRNADTSYTPERFKHVAADVQIEFALATADPKGKPTTGIIRKATSVRYWQMDDKIKFTADGGDDAWDSHQYLNIWVGDLRSLLGYSSVMGAPADRDGLVINFSAFGNTGGSYNLGRTAVHEVGHWLGLKHIWGDTYCGDDGIDDTPKQGGFTNGCPTGVRTTCDNGTSGDMYMNYMDFTSDACMNMFTKGQKEKMRSMFEEHGARTSLLHSKGLHKPWLIEEAPVEGSEEEKPMASNFRTYPNPTTSEVILDFEYDASWIGREISLVNMNGVTIQKIRVVSQKQIVSLNQYKPGIYFLQGMNTSNAKKLQQKIIKL